MRKRKLGLIPLSFLAFVMLHIAVFGMPESVADEFGTDAPAGIDGYSDAESCPVDMMIILVRDMVINNT